MKYATVVDTRIYGIVLILISMIMVSPKQVLAQTAYNNYYERLDDRLTRLFTAPRHEDYRLTEFPSDLQQVLPSEIRRLNFPEEQWVCDAALEAISGDEPIPEKERALYKVKDHYFMVAYTYYTDVDGNQLIEAPSAGVLFDSEFNLIALVMM